VRVVVTGASGFLGGVVLKNLTESGFECVGVSRRGGAGHVRVADYSYSPEGDVLVHLAEINDRAHANQLASDYESVTSRTLHALLNKGYSKVIYASSAVLYGDDDREPRQETDPVNAIDTYTRVKMASEHCVLSRRGVVARFSNIYGPGVASGNVLSHILRQLNSKGPVKLKDVSPLRDFIWVEDAASAVVRMMAPRIQGFFNIGSGVATSILNLAQVVLEESNQQGREILSETVNSRESCIVLNIKKALHQLNWSPSVSLNEGLRRLINMHKEFK